MLARRLVENKVRYIEVNRGGWDTHSNNFESVANNCADLDKGLSALLLDLEMRGLLQDTMVVLVSEFEEPRESMEAMVVTTGLMVSPHSLLRRGKRRYGLRKMDKVGRNPVEGKFVDPASLNATIGYNMGLPLNDVQYSPSGRPFKVAHDVNPCWMY